MNKKTIIIVIAAALIIGAVVYFIYANKNNSQSASVAKVVNSDNIVNVFADNAIKKDFPVAVKGTISSNIGSTDGTIFFDNYKATVSNGQFTFSSLPAASYAIQLIDSSNNVIVLDKTTVQIVGDTTLQLKALY